MNFLDRIKQKFAPVSWDDVTNKQYVDGVAATKANASHTHIIEDVTNLQTALDNAATLAREAQATAESAAEDAAAAVTAAGAGGVVAQKATKAITETTDWVISGLTPYKPLYIDLGASSQFAYYLGTVSRGSIRTAGFSVGAHANDWMGGAAIIIPNATSITIKKYAHNDTGTLYAYQ